jgi:hypothetical protein
MKKTQIIPLTLMVLILSAISTFSSGCLYIDGIDGNGKVVKQTRPAGTFDALEISSAFDVFITQGSSPAITVEADENLLSCIRTDIIGNTLKIETDRPIHHSSCLKAYITVVKLQEIGLSGAVNLKSENKISGQELMISSSGASEGTLELAYERLSMEGSGASTFRLAGTVKQVRIDFSGASELHAFDLLTENMEIDVSGAGEADVNVSQNLRVDISGAADVRYKGNPQINQRISGASSLKKVD